MKLPVKMILRGKTDTVRQTDVNQIDNKFDKEKSSFSDFYQLYTAVPII